MRNVRAREFFSVATGGRSVDNRNLFPIFRGSTIRADPIELMLKLLRSF